MTKLWVANIANDYGINTYHGRTKKAVMDQVHEYVVEWWDREIINTKMPNNKSEAIDMYFQHCESFDVLCLDISDVIRDYHEKLLKKFEKKYKGQFLFEQKLDTLKELLK